jgi:hypothetical protein
MDPATMDRPMRRTPRPGACMAAFTAPCPHARCVMHVHSGHATVLASLADSRLPPIDQNTAMFFRRHVVDDHYGGMAFESEGARCATLLADPKITVDDHGQPRRAGDRARRGRGVQPPVLFRARRRDLYPRLQTGPPLRVLPDAVAEKTAREWEDYPGFAENHLREIKAMLDAEGADYPGSR